MPKINIEYDDLMTGDSVYINAVGHIRSPKLKEMFPSTGIGWNKYNFYIFYMKSDLDQIIELFRKLGANIPDIDNSKIHLYDFIISCDLRDAYVDTFNFFMEEDVLYSEEYSCFLVMKDNTPMGFINQDNFDDVRAVILAMNYISIGKTNVSTVHSCKEAEDRWNLAQKYLMNQNGKDNNDDSMSIGNMISKLCIISNSYNLMNIYDLTIFQLYDQFMQACYMRGIDFTESIVSNHGGKDFKYEDWLKPIKNY